MFGRSVTLFELLGFKVRVDITWIFLALLVTWSLATGVFPIWYEGYSTATYWWMAVVGMIGLVFSLIFHEMSHSLVARRYGLPIKGITLFIFGGVAEMDEEPDSARTEFLMAIAGPIASFALAIGFYLVLVLGGGLMPDPPRAVIEYLAFINLLLGAFNLVPAFPLDGGRALRAALWYKSGNLSRATRIASNTGKGFGLLLIVLGLFSVLTGNFVGGLWWFLIGLFVRGAAEASFQQSQVRRLFEGTPVRRYMTHETVVTVPPDISIRTFIEDYVYEYHFDLFPVVDGRRLVGCVQARQAKSVPREEWDEAEVSRIMEPCTEDNTVEPGMDAVKAIAQMRRTGNSRLIVAEDDRLVGIVAFKDMLELLALKMDFEGEA
ncbi:MAG TPA: site-2 protease family protein [Kiloniellales bacterium]|nr:site-2 protease family protein [Kiloniellales bacterium]